MTLTGTVWVMTSLVVTTHHQKTEETQSYMDLVLETVAIDGLE